MTQTAIMGLGTVGTGVAKVVAENARQIERKLGEPLQVKTILVRHFKDGPYRQLMTDDFTKIEEDHAIRVVVETIGGVEAAYEYTKRALNAGKHVVTANKQLVAEKGAELLALAKKRGVVMLACHMDNWEWLGAALALNGFPLSAVEKPQPNPVYSDFLNELRRGAGQEIFARGTNEILGCARAMKKGRMLGLIADQDGGYHGIFVPFFGKMASTPEGPAYFARKFKAPVVPIFMVRKPSGYGHQVFVKEPIYYEDTGNQEKDDYRITLKMTQEVEKIIRQYPDNWIWFQHRWNTPWNG